MAKKDNTGIVIFIILVVTVLLLNRENIFPQTTGSIVAPPEELIFEEGWLPYGESRLAITGITSSNSDFINCGEIGTNRWWRMESTRTQTCSGMSQNDFLVFVDTGQIIDGRSFLHAPGHILTQVDFKEKQFKTFITDMGSLSAFGKVFGASVDISVCPRKTDTNDCINIYTPSGFGTKGTFHFKPIPSIPDNYEIWFAGQKIKEVEITMPEIYIRFSPGSKSGFKESRFKEDFGCTLKENEQLKLRIFREGDRVHSGLFDHFVRFCREELPVILQKPDAIGTDDNPILKIVEGEVSTVPSGQIWYVFSLEPLSDPETDCEKGLISYEQGCFKRSVVDIILSGCDLDLENLSCRIETAPVLVERFDIPTHEDLEGTANFKLIFSGNIPDREFTGLRDIQIGANTFSTSNLKYRGTDSKIVYSTQNRNDWFTTITFGGKQFDITAEEQIQLDDFLSVRLMPNGAIIDGTVDEFELSYIFTLDTTFLEVFFNSKEDIVVANSYVSIPGGLEVTTIDEIIGTTKINSIIGLNFLKGNSSMTLDVDDSVSVVKVRPFVQITTNIENIIQTAFATQYRETVRTVIHVEELETLKEVETIVIKEVEVFVTQERSFQMVLNELLLKIKLFFRELFK